MGVDGVKKIAYSINSLIINAAGYLNSYYFLIEIQGLKAPRTESYELLLPKNDLFEYRFKEEIVKKICQYIVFLKPWFTVAARNRIIFTRY
jgi:hypothetical protein